MTGNTCLHLFNIRTQCVDFFVLLASYGDESRERRVDRTNERYSNDTRSRAEINQSIDSATTRTRDIPTLISAFTMTGALDATAAIATLSDASASVDAKKTTLDAVAKCFDDDGASSIVSSDLALASTSKDLALAVVRLAAGDKKRDPENVVADLAIGVMKKMAQKTHECVVNAALVPACLEALDPKEKWQTQA